MGKAKLIIKSGICEKINFDIPLFLDISIIRKIMSVSKIASYVLLCILFLSATYLGVYWWAYDRGTDIGRKETLLSMARMMNSLPPDKIILKRNKSDIAGAGGHGRVKE